MQAGRLYTGIGSDVYTCINPAEPGPTMRTDGGLLLQADLEWWADVTELIGDVHLGACILFRDIAGRAQVGCVRARTVVHGLALFKMDGGQTVLMDRQSLSKWCMFRELQNDFVR